MKRVILDIDDVLFPWSIVIHEWCENVGITNGKTITQWYFHRDYGIEQRILHDAIREAYADGVLVDTPPFAGAVDALNELRGLGVKVHLATARGTSDHCAPRAMEMEDTINWLEEHGIEADGLSFTQDKTTLVGDVLIDDKPDHVVAYMRTGRQGVLVDSLHNRASLPVGARRVSSFKSFVDSHAKAVALR